MLSFMLFIDNLADHLVYLKLVKYKDDNVIYFPNKEITVIENKLKADL